MPQSQPIYNLQTIFSLLLLMKSIWINCVLPIAAIFSVRMLGLFMLIPIFSVYAKDLAGGTPVLIGLALGIYGLSQAALQIPLGLLSDRYGRKPILVIGLSLFIIGSIAGALSTSIYGIIIARTLQGTGAIGSVLIALLADLTPDELRTKSMAMIGASIGISFMLAMILSPIIVHIAGLAGIFYLTAIFGIIALLILYGVIPTPRKEPFHADSEINLSLVKTVLANRQLNYLNIGIFAQHFILTSTFYAIPLMLQSQVEEGVRSNLWQFYLPLMVSSFILMLPLMLTAEKKQQVKSFFVISIAAIALSQALLIQPHLSSVSLWAILCLYFIVFNYIEATLPSLVSRIANPSYKGTAVGVYSTCQFLGIFAGGTLSGIAYDQASHLGIFTINILLASLWLFTALRMQPNIYKKNLLIPTAEELKNIPSIIDKFKHLRGVSECFYSEEEKCFYLRIEQSMYTPGSAEQIIKNQTP